MNPLQQILEWYRSGAPAIREELARLSELFHIQEGIIRAEPEIATALFEQYLEGIQLPTEEIIQRTLFSKALISYCTEGRRTETGWEEAKQRHQLAAQRFPEADGHRSMQNTALEELPERKEQWIAWGEAWEQLLATSLSDRQLWAWFTDEVFRTIDIDKALAQRKSSRENNG